VAICPSGEISLAGDPAPRSSSARCCDHFWRMVKRLRVSPVYVMIP